MNLPIVYMKTEPNEYVRITANGKIKQEGLGKSKLILPFRHSVQLVNMSQQDAPFGFQEMTKDNQEVTLQGSMLYKVTDGDTIFKNFDFGICPRTKRYHNDATQLISDTLINIVQTQARELVQAENLENLLTMSKNITQELSSGLVGNTEMKNIGINVESFYINSIQPSPEIARALGAEYREQLLTKEAEATYERRAEGVKQEKAIAENELQNKIELERETANLIALEAKNALGRGTYEAEVLEKKLSVYKSLDPKVLGAYALISFGENATNLDSLTLPPEFFGNFMKSS